MASLSNKPLFINRVTWSEIRDRVAPLDPKLTALIDTFTPTADQVFYLCRYSYGAHLFKEGHFYVPSEEQTLISLDSPSFPAEIKQHLNHAPMPVCLMLSKTVEISFDTGERVMPNRILYPGNYFGLKAAFDPDTHFPLQSVWTYTAGTRSCFMLPKISDNVHHTRIKRQYGLHLPPPKQMQDHFEVFVEVVSKATQVNPWYCDILLFSDAWLRGTPETEGQVALRQHLLEIAWKQTTHERLVLNYNIAWETFSQHIAEKNWKPNAYLINTIKHLLALSAGIYPGFIPSTGDDIALPTSLLQDVYAKIYKLPHNAPIIMRPDHIHAPGDRIYYSIAMPTLFDYPIRSRSAPRLMDEIREIKRLVDMMIEHRLAGDTHFQFYHAEHDQFGEILLASRLPEDDPRFSTMLNQYEENQQFPDKSPFLKGCIAICA